MFSLEGWRRLLQRSPLMKSKEEDIGYTAEFSFANLIYFNSENLGPDPDSSKSMDPDQ
jgi:hypothetical protein